MQAAFAPIADHEAVLAGRLLDYLATKPRVRVIGAGHADQAVAGAHGQLRRSSGVAAPDIVRPDRPLRIGIRYGDFHSRRLVEHLGCGGPSGVVRVSMVHYNTVDEVDRLIAGLDDVLP